jgi:phasin family protein
MANAPFVNVFEQYQDFVAPVVKTNQQVVANVEKLVSFQIDALQAYVDFGVSRLKAAAEVSNPQDLQAFLKDQVEAANVLREKGQNDAKALAELIAEFQAEFNARAQENITEVSNKVTEVTKKTTQKTTRAA